jgi:hypothetical protein
MDDREKELELSEYVKPTCFIQVQPFSINTGSERPPVILVMAQASPEANG